MTKLWMWGTDGSRELPPPLLTRKSPQGFLLLKKGRRAVPPLIAVTAFCLRPAPLCPKILFDRPVFDIDQRQAAFYCLTYRAAYQMPDNKAGNL